MNTEQWTHVNPLPAKTWNHLKVNDALLKWDTDAIQEQELSSDEVWRRASIEIQEKTGCGDGVDFVFDGAQAWKASAAAGEEVRAEIENVETGTQNTRALLYLEAAENSKLTVWGGFHGEQKQNLALRLILRAGKNASIRLVQVLSPGEEGILINDIGGSCDEGASIEILHLYLGRGDLFSGCRIELEGSGSKFSFRTGYLEQRTQRLDVNIVANHIGTETESTILADGTLKDQAHKVFRGTIDFKRGASKSVGNEEENVLLLGDDIVNKTVPLILCAEEDVQGNHGASIGELDEDTLFYFAGRGIDRLTAERILTRGKLERLCAEFGNEKLEAKARQEIEEVLEDEAEAERI